MCLHLCQYHFVFITVALCNNLNSGMGLLYISIALALLSLLCFPIHFKVLFSLSVKTVLELLIVIALNVQVDFGRMLIFIMLILPGHQVWEPLPCSSVFLTLFLRCRTVFFIKLFFITLLRFIPMQFTFRWLL